MGVQRNKPGFGHCCNCKKVFEQTKAWRKFCSDRCRMDYHSVANPVLRRVMQDGTIRYVRTKAWESETAGVENELEGQIE